MITAEGAEEVVFIVDFLSGGNKGTEFGELQWEGSERCVVFDMVCVFAFVEAGLNF